MKEPLNPHFVLSDGNYCHFLDDRLVFGKAELPETIPGPVSKTDYLFLFLKLAAILILGFFLVMTVFAAYFIVTFTLACLLLLGIVSFFRGVKYSNTPAIMRDDILRVQYHKRSFGYDFFTILYSGENGKPWMKRLTIYDSQQCLDQALKVMKEQGLLK